MPRPHAVPSLAVVGVFAALAGCGGADRESPSAAKPATSVSGDQRSVLATVDALRTASRAGDARTICGELFTPALVEAVETSAGRGCTREVKQRLFARDAEISIGREIQVAKDRGTVVVREQNGNLSTLSLVKRDARWRIDRITPRKSG